MKQKVKRIQTILECIDLRKKSIDDIESVIRSYGFKTYYSPKYQNELTYKLERYINSYKRLHVFLDISIANLVEFQINLNPSTEIYTVVKNNLIN